MHDQQIKGRELFHRQQQSTDFSGPTIICDGIQTPENLGAILRVADACGSSRVFLLDCELDLNNKKLSKLARSAQQHLQIQPLKLGEFKTNCHKLKQIVALDITQQSSDLFKSNISNCDAVVIGHEARGIRPEVLALCDTVVHLPMHGINGSMNVSHALVVFLYEWWRQS